MSPVMDEAVLARFHAKTVADDTGECIVWVGGRSRRYGVFGFGGKMYRAHRLAYEHFVGPIPEGLQLDHLCRMPSCVNPDHLEPVTDKENRRRAAIARTHCPKGHPYDVANTLHSKLPSGGYARVCRACKRLKKRQRDEALRARRAA